MHIATIPAIVAVLHYSVTYPLDTLTVQVCARVFNAIYFIIILCTRGIL